MLNDGKIISGTWKKYDQNASSTIRNLWNDEYFADVTLATMDNHQIIAHKVILSSASSFFKNILIRNQHPKPLLYLKDIGHRELESILKFVYLGKCDLQESELELFLSTGKALEISGLSEEAKPEAFEPKLKPKKSISNVTKNKANHESQKEDRNIYTCHTEVIPLNDIHVVKHITENEVCNGIEDNIVVSIKNEVMNGIENIVLHEASNEAGEELPNEHINKDEYEVSSDHVETTSCQTVNIQDVKENETTSSSENIDVTNLADNPCKVKLKVKKVKSKIKRCNQCDYKTKSLETLIAHMNSFHEGIHYECNECDYKANHPRSLVLHKRSVHQKIRYSCDQCDHKATKAGSLTLHKRAIHEKIKYACKFCDYMASQKSALKGHQKSIHLGVKVCCDECGHKSSSNRMLSKHKQAMHGGPGDTFHCDQCDYVTHLKSSIRIHKLKKHEGLRHKCDACEYEAPYLGDLTRHKKGRHQGFRFYCDQCDYKAVQEANLRIHQQGTHEGKTYSCDLCDYQTKWPTHIGRHKWVRHSVKLPKKLKKYI